MEIGPDSKQAFDLMAQGGETVPFQGGEPRGDSPEAPTTTLDPTAPLKSTTTTLLKMKQDVEKIAADVGKDNSYKIGALNSIAQFQSAPEKQIAFYQLMRESIGNKYLAPFVEYMGRELAQEESSKKQALLQYLDNERNMERQKVVAEFQLRKQAELEDSRLKREREKEALAEARRWATAAKSPELHAKVVKLIRDKGEDFATAVELVGQKKERTMDLATGEQKETVTFENPYDIESGWKATKINPAMSPTGSVVGGLVEETNYFTKGSRTRPLTPEEIAYYNQGLVKFPPKGKSGGGSKTVSRGGGFSGR